ncbi:aromatic ring-hydroxylating oxygenase subunit alpha [Blastococcus sp. SYSU D00820]
MTVAPERPLTETSTRIHPGPLTDRSVGRSILPAAAYTDPEYFAREREAVFAGGWSWAGFTHWAAEPGAVHPIEVAGRPLLLSRDRSGELHVFHNACRHRGMLLVEEPTVTRRIRCPYHAWNYGHDGALCSAPFWNRDGGQAAGGPEEEVRAQLGLLPVRHTEWAGMVFVAFRDDVEPLETLLEPLLQRWAPIDLTRISLAEERTYEVPANWKLVVENFLDFYHLPFVHPQVGPAAAALDIDDVVLAERVMGGSYPRGAAGKAKKTEKSLPLLGEVPEHLHAAQDIFCVFPNALVFLEADWFQVIAFSPEAPDRTVEHMAVFVDSSAAGPEYAPEREALCSVLFEVNDQDMPILARLQSARRSPAADRNHLVPSWDQVTAVFQRLVADTLR